MSTFKRSPSQSKIYSADASKNIQAYDLFGEKRQQLEHLASLNRQQKAILKGVAFECIRIFNDHDCKLELSKFSEQELVTDIDLSTDTQEQSEQQNSTNNNKLIWIQASNQLKQKVFLAVSYSTLYSLTELYLGGQQSNVVKHTPVSDISESELRLLERILFIHLNALDNCFTMTNAWQTRIIDPPKAMPAQLSTCACFSVAEFQALWQLWLPHDLVTIPAKITAKLAEPVNLSEKLATAAQCIPTKLNVVLAKTQVSLAQLTELIEGDLLPIELPEIVDAYAGEQAIAQGKIVDRNGNLVMQVTQVQPLNV
ncbi:FliM/FliN family flagellar motor C-terminal domain-containing protein [Thalassotalea sp. PLHSN55]|uniref:flagellar motor switch protein FliM n=1 Tax=Thalassotalea sp. PLHSN55 TaxID=3435888 RepID=UPI003F835720